MALFRLALQNLLSRPLRTTLATLGLTVAITGMVALFAVAEGIDHLVSSTFGRISGLSVLQNGAPVQIFSSLPAEWGAEIAEIDGVSLVAPEVWMRVNLINGKRIFSPPRFAGGFDPVVAEKLTSSPYQQSIEAGRFLNSADRGTTNVVISRAIAEEFDVSLGDTLSVDGATMTIVGIYHTGSIMMDVTIVMDINLVRQMTRIDPDSVSCFYVEQTGDVPDEILKERIIETFRGRGSGSWDPGLLGTMAGMTPPPVDESVDLEEQSPIEVRDTADWTEQMGQMSNELDIFLVLLTAIGVIVAIFSVVNTMLMSVTERMIEFGILRANGWSRREIVRLITCESALLGVCGGVLGAGLGWLTTLVLNRVFADQLYLYASPMLLLFSAVFSMCLGMLGGIYPAVRASRMSPMDAIRRG